MANLKSQMKCLLSNTAIKSLDYKVANLKKKLNKLKYKREEQELHLSTLRSKREKLKEVIGDPAKDDDPTAETDERYFENEIHKTSLKLTEADMIKKKYNVILDMLKKENLSYTKQINQLETFEKKQSKDIEILEKDYEESVTYREEMRAEQKEWEDHFGKENKLRNMKIVETKKSVKEKREIFHSLETMFNKSEGTKTGDDQASSIVSGRKSPSLWPSASKVKEVGTVPGAEYSVNDFDEAFNKMARSAGVSDIAEVVERFRTQKQTSSSLHDQQSTAETDVREMGVLKEDLERQYNEVKFLGQDDVGDSREKIEEIELLIEDNMNKKRAALEQIKYIAKKQETIRLCFYGLVNLLTGADARNKPLHTMLDTCFKAVNKLSERIGDQRLDALLDQMDETGYKAGTEEDDVFRQEEEIRKRRKEESENVEAVEDEEVPTRASLRRQADIMVNAKERGRGGMRRK